jgi:iron complex outermembrane receptor protein
MIRSTRPRLIGLGGTALPADPFDEPDRCGRSGEHRSSTPRASPRRVNRDFESFTFTSITSYRRYDEAQDIDADFSDLSLVEPRDIDTEFTTFTQEFRFTSTGANFVDWMGGFFFYDNDLEFNQNLGYGVDAGAVL